MLVPMLDLTIESAAESGRARCGDRHGAPRAAQRAGPHGGPAVRDDLRRVRGRPSRRGGTAHARGRHRRREVSPRRRGRLPDRQAARRSRSPCRPIPSHLEFVAPVVDGRARAKQTQRRGRDAHHDPTAALPVVIHGDAAFAGQGVVAETLNLGALKGYRTGGTIHLITNNQVGFTTDMDDARSTRYASDLAKGFDIPIIHVNADDAEACLSAVRLAMAYRDQFHQDVLIDLVGYRRHGHNEGDEPAYTQPVMYERIKALPTVRELYAAQLVAGGRAHAGGGRRAGRRGLPAAGGHPAGASRRAWARSAARRRSTSRRRPGQEVDTALADRVARRAQRAAADAGPRASPCTPSSRKQLERRRAALGPDGGIDWAHAEALALASLLTEGVPIRLTGQDTERGTFSQRHLVLHDANTGAAAHARCSGCPAPWPRSSCTTARCRELATLGFEYGYSAAAPEALVLWEAQFGDFINGAQVIVDQFLALRAVQVGAHDAAHPAPAARLRGPGPGALERAARAVPAARGRGQHPGGQRRRRRRSTSTCSAGRRGAPASGR